MSKSVCINHLFLAALATNVVTGIAVALYMSWRLALISLAWVPLLLLASSGYGWVNFHKNSAPSTCSRGLQFMAKTLAAEMQSYAAASGVAEEVIAGIRTVLAFNGQQFEERRYTKHLAEGLKFGVRKAKWVSASSAFFNATMFTALGCTVYFGLKWFLTSDLTSGEVLVVFWIILIAVFRVGQALPVSKRDGGSLANSIASSECKSRNQRQSRRCGDFFHNQPSKYKRTRRTVSGVACLQVPELDSSSSQGKKLDQVAGRLDFEKLRFSYPLRPEIEVLKNVSFTVEAGSTVALVGKRALKAGGCRCRDFRPFWLRQKLVDSTSRALLSNQQRIGESRLLRA